MDRPPDVQEAAGHHVTDPVVTPVGGQPPPDRLEVRDVSMTFGRNRVLRDITMTVVPGEIHGLIGQNGSGKSTLAKVLTGLYSPDPGSRVAVDGQSLQLPVKPGEARARGVAVVHQSLGLVPEMTVLENMRVGRLRGGRLTRRIDWSREREQAELVFERLGRSVPLDAPVGRLREEDRATVAIARALQDARVGGGIIIFDESTRALGRRSLEHFFGMLDGIVATGTSVLLITHRLEEIVGAADRVTVLRDGRVVQSGLSTSGLVEAELARLMLGRVLNDVGTRAAPARPALDGEIQLDGGVRLVGVGGGAVTSLDLTVAAGEIVGLTGLPGSGYEDVPYLVSGATGADSGVVRMGTTQVPLRGLTPASAIRAGISLIPEGRENAGLATDQTIAENILLLRSATSSPLRPLRRRDESDLTASWIERLDVRPPDTRAVVSTLSGGNQQKVLLAKWLATDPRLLVLHEPTQAVDVGARHTIIAAVRAAADGGCAVLVAGSDENELTLLCDRILVFHEGVVVKELSGRVTADDVVEATFASGARSPLRSRARRGGR